ncbi:MAG: Hint domain-containing protein [Methanosarcinaceae archaeon]|nr:Hint domain-containing protein [Methanosarcinaceae archaeon]
MPKKAIWTPNPGAQQLAWERMDVKQLFFGGGRGCVHPETLLDTPDGPIKIMDFEGGPIFSLVAGEKIIVTATAPVYGTVEDLYEVILENGMTVVCTDEHKFLGTKAWHMLKDFDAGDLIWTDQGYQSIRLIELVDRDVYMDIHVPSTNCYFAQGILHHNSGKTSWLLGLVLTQWQLYGKSARCLILRRQFRDLREILRQGKELIEETGIGRYNSQDHIFYGKGKFKGCTLELGNLERLDDYSRYHGNAYSLVGFDEITEFQCWEMVDKMGSTCRSKDPAVSCIMRFTGNPGGRLHQEVKRRFYDPAPLGNTLLKTKDKKLPDGTIAKGQTRMMVSSTVKDNPYLWNNDPDYVTWLLSLPEVLKKAWYEGNWDIAIGSFFGDVWDARKHVVKRIQPKHVPKDWEIRRAFDWGSSTPFCLLWYTISDGDPMHNGEQFPKGAIIILWEFYGQKEGGNLNEGMKWSSIQVAQAIRRKEIEMGIFDRVIAGPADNQIYANTDGEDSNLYINFEREGVLFTRSNKSPGSTKVGLEQIRTRMVGRDGMPLMYFTEDCPNSISTIPELARHPTKMDEIDDGQIDHACDTCKYIALYHPINLNQKGIGEEGLNKSAQTRLK